MDKIVAQWYERYQGYSKCVSINKIGAWYEKLNYLMFPSIEQQELHEAHAFQLFYDGIWVDLIQILNCIQPKEKTIQDVTLLKNKLFHIVEILESDAQAILNGDPAARNIEEVIRSYPGFVAICGHRIAHFLYELKVPSIPRLLSEYIHSKTGVDIHPGAQIADSFCIDHGTGVVIGETCVIGRNVKIYQGVTLGGLSVNKADADIKRHPSISDNVVIYAGATILGGQTIIGENSIIGGNTFITQSVPANSKIYYKGS